MTKLVQKTSISKPDGRWWGFGGTEYSHDLSQLFSIGLYNLETLEVVDLAQELGIWNGIGSGGAALYYFTTPPQSYELSEPASTQVIPTQDGGKFVESQGSIFKDIRLGGTVGFRPNPVTSELIPGLEKGTGITLTMPSIVQSFTNDERGLNPKEVTGFDEITYLRNLFRAYFDIKSSNTELARKVVMVFAYLKESEIYIVEPMAFTTTRDKSSPLSWRYSIVLRTLYRFDATVPFVADPMNIFQAISTLSSTLRKLSQDISRALNQLASLVTFFANLPANLLNNIFSAAMDVLSAVAAVRNAGKSFADTMTMVATTTVMNATAEFRRLFDEKYGEETTDIQSGEIGTARHALTTLARSCEAVLALDRLWEGSKQIEVQDYSKAYLDEVGESPFNAGSPLNVENIQIPETAKEVEVIGGMDIRSLARMYLGDEAKWKVLAILNNLKYPYVSHTSGDGVLAPGDKLLVPYTRELTNEDRSVGRTINSNTNVEGLSPVVRKYGQDLRLSDSSTGTELADLQVGQHGDLDMINGPENVYQAMMIKFSTEQGELPIHPDFGAKYPIGTKLSMIKLQEFLINTRRTCLSDPRIESVLSMRAMAHQDKVFTNAKLRLKDSNFEIPVQFAVRR